MNKQLFLRLASWMAFIISAYIFSRFTVDDAFISWRHGYNLISSGFFNYNPSDFDLTQSYTNPIFAIISIVPAALGVDVVLFFKAFSASTVILFLLYLHRVHKINFAAVCFLAIPAAMIHISSGLETFLFVVALVLLYDSLKNEAVITSVLITSLLFLIRPESFLLAVLVPLYFLSDKGGSLNPFSKIKSIFSRKEEVHYLSLLLPLILFFILLFHKLYFGSYLPNTFYVKSINNTFSFTNIITVFLVSIPALAFLLVTSQNKNNSLFYVFFLFFLAVTINYTFSSLKMNYASRFIFHIYAPIFFILLIENKSAMPTIKVTYRNTTFESNLYAIFATLLFTIYFMIQLRPSELLHLSQYYPRAQLAHSQLGFAIKDSGARSMSFGDAGVTAFNSKMDSLDYIGLGSSLVAKYGVTDKVLETYNPDVVVFYSRPQSGIRLRDTNQENLFQWVEANNLTSVCEVIWDKDYSLLVYAKVNVNTKPIVNVCNESTYNVKSRISTFKRYVLSPPWKFWNNQRLEHD